MKFIPDNFRRTQQSYDRDTGESWHREPVDEGDERASEPSESCRVAYARQVAAGKKMRGGSGFMGLK